MKQTLRKVLSLLIVIAVFISISLPIQAAGDPTGVLDVVGDGATPKEHQALTMSVNSVASKAPLQAFCIGWNFTFKYGEEQVDVYVPLSFVDKNGGSRNYIFPLTTGWTKASTGIAGVKSIRDLVSDKAAFDQIIKAGCTVYADARIQKNSYSSSTGRFTELSTYANSGEELSKEFSEFTPTFISNTIKCYYNLSKKLKPEPPVAPPAPTVAIIKPPDGLTVLVGATFTITGDAKYCKSVDVLVNGEVYKTFDCVFDPSTGYYEPYHISTTYTAPATGEYKVQLIGHGE